MGILAGMCICLAAASIYLIRNTEFNTVTDTPPPAATEALLTATFELKAATDIAGAGAFTGTPASIPTLTPDPRVLFQDDFSDPNGGWTTYANASRLHRQFGDGQFLIQAFRPNEDIWSVAGQNFADASIEVDATKTGGPDNNDFGLICRYQDDNNFYFFIISSDGKEAIGMYQGGRQPEPLGQ